MHFSIPESEEITGPDSVFWVYKIHVNGEFHAALRYSQLLSLHQQLRKCFSSGLPSFPPKKLLSLSKSEHEERRVALENYIQHANQVEGVATSQLFTTFLRLAQHETSGEKVEKRNLAVFLPNGHRLTFDILNNESTSSLLTMVADELKLRSDWIQYFSIFMFRRNSNGTWNVLRKLGDYESPYVSLSWKTSDYRLVLRKCNWDNSKDDVLMEDRVGLHLLYVQTVSDIENGWISIPKEHLKTLTVLQSHGEKAEYLRHARQLKFYGTIKFSSCQSSFVHPGVLLAVYIGNRELIFVTSDRQEVIFKLTRIKCWRISLVHETRGLKAELSFEYLQANDKLEWFSIVSEQAVLMAVCLQEMVTDMIVKQQPSVPSRTGAGLFGNSVYVRRDGGKVQLNGSPVLRVPVPVSAIYRPNPSNSSNRVSENSVFLGIGDDDL